MLPFVFAAAIAAVAPAACKLDLAPGATVIERRRLDKRRGALEAVSVSEPDPDIPATRVTILGRDCKVIFQQRFEGATQQRFDLRRLGDQPILVVTAFTLGGSGCGYDHLIIAYGGHLWDSVESLAPSSLSHSNTDGFFVGDLGRGRGPSLATWVAQRDAGGHYASQSYEIVEYRWRGERFTGPKVWDTRRKYDPSNPDAVAGRLGLGFHDLSQRVRVCD